jgi:methyltransferase (TIGR00027 family)
MAATAMQRLPAPAPPRTPVRRAAAAAAPRRRWCAAAAAANALPSALASPLAAAADVAAARAAFPRLCPADPYAAALVKAACGEGGGGGGDGSNAATPPPTHNHLSPADAAATAWIDAHALRASDLVNLDVDAGGAEYKQVVLIGPGLDTRPFRLPWPDGTAFFEVAPADSLSVAAATLAAAGAAVPRTCLLRRVLGDVTDSTQAWVDALADAGFRGDRLSIVCLQAGTSRWSSLTRPALRSALAAVARCAARGSFVFGDLPAWVASREDAADLLAEAGLVVGSLERPGASEESGAAGWGEVDDEGRTDPRWLFASQQSGRSDEELAIWAAHAMAAEEADEDFEGHFS